MCFVLCALNDVKAVKLIKNVLPSQHLPSAYFLVKY